MKIYAPVKDFNGFRNNVRFVNGVGETDNPQLLEWFKTHGYKVPIESIEIAEKSLEKCVETVEKSPEKCETPDFDAMTPNELREWMKENGYGFQMKNIRDKEKLLKIIRG